MAFSHGKNGYFALGSVGTETTTVDLSAYFDTLDFPSEIGTAETTTFGQDTRTYVIGLRDASFSGSGPFDPTPDAQFAAALGHETALDFEYSPEGNATGDVLYSGSCFITSYDVSTGVDDMVNFSIDLQVTGSVTRTTV